MASPTQLIECMSKTLGITEATCDSTWKKLRSDNLVVNSGRGKRGTKVTARDCAVFLIALCGADNVEFSVEAAKLYGSCVLQGGEDDQDELTTTFSPLVVLGPRHTLLDAVTALIEAYRLGNIPDVETAMVLPNGRKGVYSTQPRVYLVLKIPPPSRPAEIRVDHSVVAEYFHQRSFDEMFADLFKGKKSRIGGRGDLQIEKRVSNATFEALAELLRESSMEATP